MLDESWNDPPDPSTTVLADSQAARVTSDGKRKLPSGGSHGGGGGGRREKRQRVSNEVGVPKWACFFFKRDPRQYSRCRTQRFTRLCDVTQHLERQHKQPFYCPVCGDQFAGQDRDRDRFEHVRQRRCQEREFDPPPGLTMDQMQALRKTTEAEAPGATNVEERRWYGKYKLLFGPDSHPPESPYNTNSEPGIENEIFQATCDTIQSFRTQGHLQSVIQSAQSVRYPTDLQRFAIQVLEAYRVFVARSLGLEPISSGHTALPAPPLVSPDQPPSHSIWFPNQVNFDSNPAVFDTNLASAPPAGFSATPIIPSQTSLVSAHDFWQPDPLDPYQQIHHDQPDQHQYPDQPRRS